MTSSYLVGANTKREASAIMKADGEHGVAGVQTLEEYIGDCGGDDASVLECLGIYGESELDAYVQEFQKVGYACLEAGT